MPEGELSSQSCRPSSAVYGFSSFPTSSFSLPSARIFHASSVAMPSLRTKTPLPPFWAGGCLIIMLWWCTVPEKRCSLQSLGGEKSTAWRCTVTLNFGTGPFVVSCCKADWQMNGVDRWDLKHCRKLIHGQMPLSTSSLLDEPKMMKLPKPLSQPPCKTCV